MATAIEGLFRSVMLESWMKIMKNYQLLSNWYPIHR